MLMTVCDRDYIELTCQLYFFDICLFTYGIINQEKNKDYLEHKSKIPIYLYPVQIYQV